jgi:GTPase SAR1 family protein
MGNCLASIPGVAGGGGKSSSDNKPQQIEQQLEQDAKQFSRTHKLLLLGAGESGKSTIAKQVRLIHLEGFTEDERAYFRMAIHKNTIQGMQELVRGCEEWEYPFDDSAQKWVDLILEVDEPYTLTDNVRDAVKFLWPHPNTQKAWQRVNELQVVESAKHFCEEIDRISKPNFIPTNQDILQSRAKTTGVIEMMFKVGDHEFWMVDVGGQRNERRKWLNCFEDVTAVIFCVAMSEFDRTLYEDNTKNRMHEACELFEQTMNSKWFSGSGLILFLNKSDLFKEKIKKVDLKVAFPEYDGGCAYEPAAAFLKKKFRSLLKHRDDLHIHITCATDTKHIQTLLDKVTSSIIEIFVEQNKSVDGLQV